MIRILIAEDSGVIALLLKTIFEQQPDMEVVGQAQNGKDAAAMVSTLKPDIVTMDIRMPIMDGLEAIGIIMEQNPTPIIVVSANVNDEEMKITFRAIEAGALAVIEKPQGYGHPDLEDIRRELVDTVRCMAGLKVARRRRSITPSMRTAPVAVMPAKPSGRYDLVAIGLSTGGPQALLQILKDMPANFPVPIVVVQHISPNFIGGMINWLQAVSPLRLKLAELNESLQPGTVYFAPDNQHLKVTRVDGIARALLDDSDPVNRFRPSATPMMQSVARHFPGSAIGIILTGMGADGAEGLLAMRRAGCRTLVQDAASAVIYSMPTAALALEAVDEVVALGDLPAYLVKALTADTKHQGIG